METVMGTETDMDRSKKAEDARHRPVTRRMAGTDTQASRTVVVWTLRRPSATVKDSQPDAPVTAVLLKPLAPVLLTAVATVPKHRRLQSHLDQ